MSRAEKLTSWLVATMIVGVVALYMFLNWVSAVPPAKAIVDELLR